MKIKGLKNTVINLEDALGDLEHAAALCGMLCERIENLYGRLQKEHNAAGLYQGDVKQCLTLCSIIDRLLEQPLVDLRLAIEEAYKCTAVDDDELEEDRLDEFDEDEE